MKLALASLCLLFLLSCKPDWPRCRGDDDCMHEGRQYWCIQGLCQECRGAADCPAGFVCFGGRCNRDAVQAIIEEPAEQPDNTPAANVDPECNCVLGPVLFDFDRAELKPAAVASLEVAAQCWASQPPAVTIEGHCDDRGTDEYNLALGQRRAVVVKTWLKRRLPGLSAGTLSYGEANPVCDEQTEQCWARNRRANARGARDDAP